MRANRVVVGLLAWLVGGLGVAWWAHGVDAERRTEGRQLATELWQFALAPRRIVRLRWTDPLPIEEGDPIYRVLGPDQIVQVGQIRRLLGRQSGAMSGSAGWQEAEALLYPDAPEAAPGTFMTYYATPTSMNWVVETMLPPAKREQIAQEIMAAYETYHAEILEVLKPVLIASLVDAARVVQQDLGASFELHRAELEALGNRYQEQLFAQEVIPLVRETIWPKVRRHAEPLANQVGQEIWQRASIWRFGWRYLYDASFLPEKNLTLTEWQRFVEQDVIPVLNKHSEDFIEVQRQILLDIAHDPQVRSALRRNAIRVADDTEFRALVWQMLREVLVDNPRLREAMERRWQSSEAQWAIQLAGYRIETSVRTVGDLLLGTREKGISPEFAQVLRNQILDKDCRWLVWEPPTAAPGLAVAARETVVPVRLGHDPMINPFSAQLKDKL